MSEPTAFVEDIEDESSFVTKPTIAVSVPTSSSVSSMSVPTPSSAAMSDSNESSKNSAEATDEVEENQETFAFSEVRLLLL